MHNLLKLSLAATLLASSASLALAQDVKAGAQVGVDAGAAAGAANDAAGAAVNAGGNANANANANANVDAGKHNYGSLISSINSKAKADLSAVTDATTVNIVLVSSLQGDAAAEASALDNALSKEADGLTQLRADIGANATVKAKVEAAGHSVDDIVAVNTEADGSLTVYVDDRA